MNDPFESRLARTPRTPLDPAWRASVLKASVSQAVSVQRNPQSNSSPTWTYAWSILAATWIAIFGLGLLSPDARTISPPTSPASHSLTDWRAHMEARRQLLGTLLDDGSALEPLPTRSSPPAVSRPRGDLPAPGFGQQRPRASSNQS